MYGKQLIAKLKAEGWQIVRIQGSHHILKKPGVPGSVPVPVHGSVDLPIGIIKSIEKQTGVKLK